MDLDIIRRQAQIIIEGRFESKDIFCLYDYTGLSFTTREKSCIERRWNEVTKYNPHLFNGHIFHIHHHKIYDSKMVFHMFKSNFKEYVGTNSDEFKRLFGEKKVVRPISVGTMVITSDNKWIIGRRSNTYEYNGSYALIAGSMDPTYDIINSKPDPFSAIKREMKEEGAIQDDDIDSIRCLGLDGVNQPYLAFSSMLTIPFDEFSNRVSEKSDLVKLKGLKLTKEAIENFVSHNFRETTPHALANILMYYFTELQK